VGNGCRNSQGLISLAANLVLDVFLVQAQNFWSQLDVTRLVNTVHITECSGNREIRADFAQRVVDLMNIAALRVKRSVVDISVINAVFFTASDTDFHLKPNTNLIHPLKVLAADGNILFFGLFRKVEHMRGEEGLLVLLVVRLIGFEHTVEPLQELLGAVVRVEDDRHSIRGSDGTDIVRGGDGTGNGRLLVLVIETLAAEEGTTALGDLDDYRRLDVAGCL